MVKQDSTAGFNIDLNTSNESSQEGGNKMDFGLILGGRDSATTEL